MVGTPAAVLRCGAGSVGGRSDKVNGNGPVYPTNPGLRDHFRSPHIDADSLASCPIRVRSWYRPYPILPAWDKPPPISLFIFDFHRCDIVGLGHRDNRRLRLFRLLGKANAGRGHV